MLSWLYIDDMHVKHFHKDTNNAIYYKNRYFSKVEYNIVCSWPASGVKKHTGVHPENARIRCKGAKRFFSNILHPLLTFCSIQ